MFPLLTPCRATKASGIKRRGKKRMADVKACSSGVGSGSMLPAVDWALEMDRALAKSTDINYLDNYCINHNKIIGKNMSPKHERIFLDWTTMKQSEVAKPRVYTVPDAVKLRLLMFGDGVQEKWLPTGPVQWVSRMTAHFCFHPLWLSPPLENKGIGLVTLKISQCQVPKF